MESIFVVHSSISLAKVVKAFNLISDTNGSTANVKLCAWFKCFALRDACTLCIISGLPIVLNLIFLLVAVSSQHMLEYSGMSIVLNVVFTLLFVRKFIFFHILIICSIRCNFIIALLSIFLSAMLAVDARSARCWLCISFAFILT